MSETTIQVKGMSCQGCVRSVTNVLEALPGVHKAEVSLERGEARVAYDAAKLAREAMTQAIGEAGFDAA